MRLIAGLAILLSVLCFATGVSAHASLVSAEPSDSSVLAQAPKTGQLRFNEAVTPAGINPVVALGRAPGGAGVRTGGDAHLVAFPGNPRSGTPVASDRTGS